MGILRRLSADALDNDRLHTRSALISSSSLAYGQWLILLLPSQERAVKSCSLVSDLPTLFILSDGLGDMNTVDVPDASKFDSTARFRVENEMIRHGLLLQARPDHEADK